MATYEQRLPEGTERGFLEAIAGMDPTEVVQYAQRLDHTTLTKQSPADAIASQLTWASDYLGRMKGRMSNTFSAEEINAARQALRGMIMLYAADGSSNGGSNVGNALGGHRKPDSYSARRSLNS